MLCTHPLIAPQVVLAASMANLSLVEGIQVHHSALLLEASLEIVRESLRHTLSCSRVLGVESPSAMAVRLDEWWKVAVVCVLSATRLVGF
jgi:hypothetical protein